MWDLPLPYTPKAINKEPCVLFKLGSTSLSLELGQEFDLTSTVNIFTNIYFRVLVTGFYKGIVLVQVSGDIFEQAKKSFFSSHSQEDYRRLSEQEYYSLYPEELKLLPKRVITY
ncbi:hypothetical protein PQG02_28270 [Nostoc sp. UHCC 0926]|uniref:hypothetical protein n=1 Tax=unclassified Nostoc TaxID=2593658 RepID=UPI002361D987|nr:hypothetical protein [Nostoc sp. UHCC 0926]WDD32503.1 hypothetical protein PQG02_28270 [Nostoc sp. UHCC 0926]